MAMIVIRPMDQIMARYGADLAKLGNQAQVHKVIARAANYESRKAFTVVKRALRQQTSIPNSIVQRSVRFYPARTKGGEAVVSIIGHGKELSLKVFGAKQNKRGVRARVWGRSQQYDGQFMGPKPGAIAMKLKGHAFARAGADRLPIEKKFGPGIAPELVRDQSAEAFYASAPKILARVAKEIAAVLRGY